MHKSIIRPKDPRVQLAALQYHKLCQQVLKRDNWRCQICGGMKQLQVHHQEFRSQGGHDLETNLITICGSCHDAVHGKT